MLKTLFYVCLTGMVFCSCDSGKRSLNTSGMLDPTFSASGTTAIEEFSSALAVALQSDGKIVVVGTGDEVSGSSFVLSRYDTYGYLDKTFGDPLVRYKNDGSIDTVNIATGKINAEPWHLGEANAVVIQADSKIVVGGSVDNAFALYRYTPDGRPDTAFNTNTKANAVIDGSSLIKSIKSISIQPDGKLVVAGSVFNGVNNFALARYTPHGSLDPTFNVTGKVITVIGPSSVVNAVAIQPDGKIVAVGSAYDQEGHGSGFVLARYNTNGSLDTTFNTTGKVVTAIGSISYGNAVAIQVDGKIVVAGSANNGTSTGFALARYNADGSLDTTFNNTGKVITIIGGFSNANAIAIQPDGKIMVAGEAYSDGRTNFALARYNVDGSIDNTFNAIGNVITSVGLYASAINAIAIQPDSKIVVGGKADTSESSFSDSNFVLARYLSY